MNLDLTSTISITGTLEFLKISESSDLIVETGSGKPNANSYISLEEANSYFENKRLNSSSWTSTSDANKKIALKMATSVLDHEVQWKGEKRYTAGSLRWPRNWVYDDDGALLSNDYVPSTVREATAEMALWLLGQDRFTNRSGIGLKKLRVDVIELEFDKYDKVDLVPSFIRRMLIEFGDVHTSSGIKTQKLIRS
jgi:hypothetical protein